MTLELLAALAAFTFITSVTPGPNNLMVMASGANFGLTRTLPHIFGVICGFQFMLWTVGAGLITALETYPISTLILKFASAAFLLYLAWNFANAAPPENGADEKLIGKPMSFLQGAAFQWVNPKAWALSIGALGAFVTAEQSIVGLLTISIAFILLGAPCVFAWTLLGTQLRRLFRKPLHLKIFNWTCAALLAASVIPVLTSTT
ncbi:MAG: LysE family translocator [Marinicaulis sp.]|nr:LysE family translocator [Marinicaulis sp.]NNE41353.1 LysE family translocator [Marinicaulis sp.]NNL87459.1 LysE family translocator [Marinicaulis sp.]